MLPGDRPIVLCAAPGIPACGPSGASAHLRAVSEALGAVALVVARRADRRGVAEESTVPVWEVGVPGWPSWLRRFRDYTEVISSRRAARMLMSLSPSLVWERHSLYSDAGWKAHAQGIPWVLEVNAPLILERQRFEALHWPRWAGAWEREVLQAAPRIVAVSAWLCRWLREEIGCRGQVLHVPNGVLPFVGDRVATRARLGVENKFVIGFIGSMKPWHGVERLPELLDRFPEAVGLCVGEGPVKIQHPRLIVMGQQPESQVAHLAAAMDVGLAPYAPDAPPWFCPLKILAYRAQGTPVVAPDIGDCRLLVGDAGSITNDFAEGIRAWQGRRVAPALRPWSQVIAEAFAG